MNQLLRLPLLKYTHSEKRNTYVKEKREKVIIIKRKTVPSSLSKKKRIPTTPQTEVSMAAVKEQEPTLLSQRPLPQRS